MIIIKRSVDFNKDVTWLASELDEAKRRSRMLYAGSVANDAIKAAVEAGMPREEAVQQAQAELARCRSEVQDTISV